MFSPPFLPPADAMSTDTKKNSLFLKKSSVRFFQKQAVFFSEQCPPDFQRVTKSHQKRVFLRLESMFFNL
jgi:hypothetical protein